MDVLSRTPPDRLAILKSLVLNLSAFSRQTAFAQAMPFDTSGTPVPCLAAE